MARYYRWLASFLFLSFVGGAALKANATPTVSFQGNSDLSKVTVNWDFSAGAPHNPDEKSYVILSMDGNGPTIYELQNHRVYEGHNISLKSSITANLPVSDDSHSLDEYYLTFSICTYILEPVYKRCYSYKATLLAGGRAHSAPGIISGPQPIDPSSFTRPSNATSFSADSDFFRATANWNFSTAYAGYSDPRITFRAQCTGPELYGTDEILHVSSSLAGSTSQVLPASTGMHEGDAYYLSIEVCATNNQGGRVCDVYGTTLGGSMAATGHKTSGSGIFYPFGSSFGIDNASDFISPPEREDMVRRVYYMHTDHLGTPVAETAH